MQKVEDAVECGEIILDVDEYDGREIVPSEYFMDGKVPEEADISLCWHVGEEK